MAHRIHTEAALLQPDQISEAADKVLLAVPELLMMIIAYLPLRDLHAAKHTCRQWKAVIDSMEFPFYKAVKAERLDSPATRTVALHPEFFTKAGLMTSEGDVSRHATIIKDCLPHVMTHQLHDLYPRDTPFIQFVELKIPPAFFTMQVSQPAAATVRVHARGHTDSTPRLREILVQGDAGGLTSAKLLLEVIRLFQEAELKLWEARFPLGPPSEVTGIGIDAIEVLDLLGSQRERKFEYGHYLAVNGSYDGK